MLMYRATLFTTEYLLKKRNSKMGLLFILQFKRNAAACMYTSEEGLQCYWLYTRINAPLSKTDILWMKREQYNICKDRHFSLFRNRVRLLLFFYVRNWENLFLLFQWDLKFMTWGHTSLWKLMSVKTLPSTVGKFDC